MKILSSFVIIWALMIASWTAFMAHARAQTPAPTLAQTQMLTCLTGAVSREAVVEHHLIAPLVAVRAAQASLSNSSLPNASRAELLSSKLCQVDNTFVYEVTLLERGGRVLRVILDAANGKILAPLGSSSNTR